ncbi:hypothetical protein BpHYR1_032102 [Brachionus plicatilis]|uniref:Uncharacterized protein n=1 Tax=Brachionus plicatilis TaxID=10195 RepID=A0A3M7RC26_BRAPC|nr:hypothetical protein BpHYR1_032102 [Brachionus plicatilis]
MILNYLFTKKVASYLTKIFIILQILRSLIFANCKQSSTKKSTSTNKYGFAANLKAFKTKQSHKV